MWQCGRVPEPGNGIVWKPYLWLFWARLDGSAEDQATKWRNPTDRTNRKTRIHDGRFDFKKLENREIQEKCISLLDCQTELNHTVWQWLFRATEIVQVILKTLECSFLIFNVVIFNLTFEMFQPLFEFSLNKENFVIDFCAVLWRPI